MHKSWRPIAETWFVPYVYLSKMVLKIYSFVFLISFDCFGRVLKKVLKVWSFAIRLVPVSFNYYNTQFPLFLLLLCHKNPGHFNSYCNSQNMVNLICLKPLTVFLTTWFPYILKLFWFSDFFLRTIMTTIFRYHLQCFQICERLRCLVQRPGRLQLVHLPPPKIHLSSNPLPFPDIFLIPPKICHSLPPPSHHLLPPLLLLPLLLLLLLHLMRSVDWWLK